MPTETRNIMGSFKVLLKVMQPYAINFEHMIKEKTFPDCSLRPIEIWGNWLLCAVLRKNISGEISFADDTEGDGYLVDKRNKSAQQLEHVSATNNPFSKITLPKGEQRIIDAINLKIAKGPSYAQGKVLIVFTDGAGEWFRNKVREAINGRHNFIKVILISLLTNDQNGLAYSVTELFENDSVTHKVQIDPDFSHWTVNKMK